MQLSELRIAGFGGQGVILSAVILGKAASIHQGAYATMTQNFGPEARGGASSPKEACHRAAKTNASWRRHSKQGRCPAASAVGSSRKNSSV